MAFYTSFFWTHLGVPREAIMKKARREGGPFLVIAAAKV